MNDKDFLIEEEVKEEVKDLKEISKGPHLKKAKRTLANKITISSLVMLIITALLFGFGLVWQRRTDLWAVSNAIWLTFAIELFVAWILFVYNKNILSPLIHGFKTFGLMFVGKRVKESYYEYKVRIEENPVPKYIYLTIFVFTILLLIAGIITSSIVFK